MASHWLEHVGAEVITHLSDRWVVRHVAAGSTILRPGAAALGVCFVLSGTLRVQVATGTPTPVTLALVGPGEIVGELALFDGEAFAAEVSAVEFSQVAWIDRERSRWSSHDLVLLCVSGRGDKDVAQVSDLGAVST